nr:ferrous iron transport protein A [Defluviicoccus vanus]
MTTTIGDLAIGDRGRVVRLLPGHRGYRERLLAMGLTPGTEFVLKRLAPWAIPWN